MVRFPHHLLPLLATCLTLAGCAGHASRTLEARDALDAGDPERALSLLNEELDVSRAEDQPADLSGDQALLLLDRAMVLQQLGRYKLSAQDLNAADKAIDLLDLKRATADELGRYLFSDDSGSYSAPPYEKLLINTMNLVNYLRLGELNGARVEARRLSVVQRYLRDQAEPGAGLSGPGSYLAGFAFEYSGRATEALRYYDEALQYGDYASLHEPVRRLAARSSYRSPRIRKLLGGAQPEEQPPEQPRERPRDGELLVVVSYGRAPAKVAKRLPIGLALTHAASHMPPSEHARANRLAAQGLVTWVNYPALGRARGAGSIPDFSINGRTTPLEPVIGVDLEARAAWREAEGAVIGAAITRMLTRLVAGEVARQAAGDSPWGILLSLGTQATLTAADTPDTRSWAMLPARMAFGRQRLAPGTYDITLTARGFTRTERVRITPGGFALLNLTVLS
ncbi:MAG: hypothetical protein KIT72_01930 [Polyangiaceae bacterium]|nr:hypothetical protein [Polyangiaceae bacterium]MCW5789157.1 hypothetical protein [Polyangiaceae bacterium]